MAVSWDQTGLPHAFLRAAAPVFYEVSGGSLLCEKLNDLTVITNDLRIALLLCPSKEPRTIMLGGRILREMGGVAGALAAEELASLLLMTSRGQMFRGACEEAGAFCLQPVFAARRAGSGCAVLFDGLEGRGVAGGLPPRLRCVHALGERHGFLQQAHRFDAARQYRRGDRRHRHHADQQGGAAGGACQLHRTYGDPGRVVALPRSADDVRGGWPACFLPQAPHVAARGLRCGQEGSRALLALIIATVIVGIIGGIGYQQIVASITKGFGGTLGSIGIIIGIGVMMGQLFEVSGAAKRMALSFLKLFGKGREEIAMAITGFLVSIPIFCDSGFIILTPLAKAISSETRKSIVSIGIALACGLVITHTMVPPTPGPVGVAGIFEVNVGSLILWGARARGSHAHRPDPLRALGGKKIWQIRTEDGDWTRE